LFMRHHTMTKGMGPKHSIGAVDDAFRNAGVRQVATGNGWRLGDSGGALVLCQVMAISNEQSHIITVAASESEQGLGICDTVSSRIEGSVLFDE